MKNILPLVIILLMSYTCISQGLKPKLIQDNKDTLLCFTIPQSRIIAGMVSNGHYCDSISTQQSKIILQQDSLNILYKQQLSLLQNIIVNDNAMIKNYSTEQALLKSDVKVAQKETKKFKRQRWYFLAIGLLGGFGISKI